MSEFTTSAARKSGAARTTSGAPQGDAGAGDAAPLDRGDEGRHSARPHGEEASTAPSTPGQADKSPATHVPGLSRSTDNGLLLNWILPIALLALAAALVIALGTQQPQQRPPADASLAGIMRSLPPVEVTPIRSLEETGADLQLRIDGTVVPYREVQIATEVAGRIIYKSPKCEAGSYVNEGEVLMRIDPTDYELEVEQLERQREQAYQAIREADQEMANTRRLIELAQQDVALQQRELDRLTSLPSGFASQAELDAARRAILQATQTMTTNENQLELLKQRRASLEASEQLAAAQLRAAQVNLARTEIAAPIDGVVVTEDAELNTFVARGNPIVTMEDTSKVEVAANLRMDQLYWITRQSGETFSNGNNDSSGDRAESPAVGYDLPTTPAVIEYEVTGLGGGAVYRWKGRLIGYDGIGLDPQTRTVPVRVLVDNPSQFIDDGGRKRTTAGPTTLVRGMYVRIKLLVDPKGPLVVIPAVALKPGNRVWVFQEDADALKPPVDDPANVAENNADGIPPASAVQPPPAALPLNELPADEIEGRDDFEPSRWIAGRVHEQRGVVPIDSLTLSNQPDHREDEFEAGALLARDGSSLWVCEVRDGSLTSGSMVVTSPLGTMDEDGMFARARKANAEMPDAEIADADMPGTAVPGTGVKPLVQDEVERGLAGGLALEESRE